MKKYRCIKPFSLDHYDENGFMDETQVEVKAGEEFELSEAKVRFCGGENSFRLERGYAWIEIEIETLNEFFEEVKD